MLSPALAARDDIRLINAGAFDSIADVYNRAISSVESEFTAIWDDDDMYFPWHLSTGIDYLRTESAQAFKPKFQLSWMIGSNRRRYGCRHLQ